MLKPLDRHRRESTLFKFTTQSPRDFIDPHYLLIQIDEQFDFAKLVAPLLSDANRSPATWLRCSIERTV